jgi:hypothetical protein
MPGIADTFGVALKAYTDLDKSSLDRATKTIGDSFGKAYSGSGKSAVGARDAIKEGTKETANFGGAIARVRDSLNATWHTSGLGKTVEQVRDANRAVREFHDQAEKTGRLFGTVGSGVMGLAGLGGIGMALQRFATGSLEISNTAGTFGVSTSMLQRFRGAAGLAGLSPEAATGAIGNLQKSLFAAQHGTPEGAQALGAAHILGLDVNEDPAVFLKHLAGKIKGQLPQIQREIAQSFGVEELLPLLRRGSAAIDELTAAAKRHRELSTEELKQGDALGLAYNAATQSTLGFADALAAHLSPSLTPLLTSFSTWLDNLKKDKDAMDLAGKGVEAFAALIGVTLVASVAKLGSTILAWNASVLATPLGRLILGAYAGYELFGAAKDIQAHPEAYGVPNKPGDMGDQPEGYFDGLSGAWGAIKKWWGGNTAPGKPTAGDPRGMIPVIRAAATKYGIDPDVAVRVFGAEGLGNYVGDNGTSFGAPQLHIGGGLGDTFQRETGLNPADQANEAAMIDWSMRNLSKTGWGPYHGAARIGIGDRQGIGTPGAVAGMLNNLPPFPNDTATVHQILTQTPLEAKGDLGSFVASHWAGVEGLRDTHHHVEITAPPGYGTNVRNSKGPADLTLRTQTAFQSP